MCLVSCICIIPLTLHNAWYHGSMNTQPSDHDDSFRCMVVEHMAQAAYRACGHDQSWQDAAHDMREQFRRQQMHVYEALVDTGIMPTEQVWGVQHPERKNAVFLHDVDGQRITSQEQALASARSFVPPDTVVTRYMTTWRAIGN